MQDRCRKRPDARKNKRWVSIRVHVPVWPKAGCNRRAETPIVKSEAEIASPVQRLVRLPAANRSAMYATAPPSGPSL
jgi:hypothetical protein